MKRIIRTILRILAWFLAGLILLLLLVIILIQTPPVKKQIARIIENQAANYLNAELKIGKLEGNFWSHLQFSQLSLIQKSDTIAAINELDLTYKLWPLIRQKVEIKSISITYPSLKLIQLKDSSWNVEHLMIEQQVDTASSDSSSASPWIIDLKRVNLQEGSIRATSSDSMIPQRIEQLNLLFSAYYSEQKQQLTLDKFAFNTQHPNVSIKQLTFDLKRENEITSLKSFILQTALNKVNADVLYAENPNENSVLSLQTAPLQVDEFAFALPDIRLKIQPQIAWKAQLKNDSLISEISLTDQEQQIRISLKSKNFGRWMNHPDSTELNYLLKTELESVRVDEWSGIADLNYLLNGQLELRGSGTDKNKMQGRLHGNLHDSQIAGYLLNQMETDLNYRNGALDAVISVKGTFGTLAVKGTLNDLFGNPGYQANLQTNHLNLAPILNNDSLQTDINLKASVHGSGFDPDMLTAKALIVLSPSMIMNIPVDTAYADLSFAHENVQIDSLLVANRSVKSSARGNYSLNAQSDLNLNAEILSLNDFKRFLPDTLMQTSGKLEAQLWGTPDSLQIQSKLVLNETSLDQFRIEKAQLFANGYISSKAMVFDTKITGEAFKSSFLSLDSIRLDSRIYPDSLHLQASVRNKDLSSQLQTNLSWADTIRIRLNNWILKVKQQQWSLHSPAIFTMDSTEYRIHHFNFHSENNQSITANGTISQKGAENFNLKIENVNISEILKTLDNDPGFSGFLNFNLNLAGTAQSPQIDGSLKIDSADYAGFQLTKATGTLHYNAQKLQFKSELALKEQGQFTANGEIPLDLNLETLSQHFSPDDQLDIQVKINDLPLSLIRGFITVKEVEGLINGEITVNGSMNAPKPIGNLKLSGGKISIPEFGIDYSGMELRSSFDNHVISLDTLGISSHDGNLTGGGEARFKEEFYKGQIQESSIKLKFNKFNPIDHKQVNMQLNGNATLNGANDAMVFGGDLEIPQSEINLQALLSMFGKVYTPEISPSILVQELEKQKTDTDTIDGTENASVMSDSLKTNPFENLTGKLKIRIPKNTWVKSPNMHIELSGDLEILKNANFFEIFGSVNIVRGQYELFGRTFVISEGVVTFQGGEEINPDLNLEANYTIKSQDSESKILNVLVTGDAMDPTLSFTLDEESISEGDALSYIVFGKSLNELSTSQQAGVSDASTESMAKSAAASMLASQLTKMLGNTFDVDYLEIKSQEDFDSASLSVGKYLTNDLFVSYEQQLGTTTDYDVSRYEVKLEYQILKFLFLQLNNSTNDSGFDLIFKIKAD